MKPRGRIDHDQQDAVIKLEPVREKVEHLEMLYGVAVAAKDHFADAVKTVAEESGLLAAVVRKFVVARASEKFDEKKRQCEQLSLVFEEVVE
jgi:hypothetical protein